MEKYFELCEQNEKRNEVFLDLFKKWLTEKNLAKKTIDRHMRNINFYLNVYLTRPEVIPMEKGMDEIGMFFSYFFIRKCMWSTPNTVSENCTSLKKFYECMFEHQYVTKEDYEMLCFVIKEERSEWMDECRRYNDGESDWYNY